MIIPEGIPGDVREPGGERRRLERRARAIEPEVPDVIEEARMEQRDGGRPVREERRRSPAFERDQVERLAAGKDHHRGGSRRRSQEVSRLTGHGESVDHPRALRAGFPHQDKTRSVFERYNIVSEEDLKEAVQKLGGESPCCILISTLCAD